MNNLNITFVGTKLDIFLDKNKKTRIIHRKKETKKRLPFYVSFSYYCAAYLYLDIYTTMARYAKRMRRSCLENVMNAQIKTPITTLAL